MCASRSSAERVLLVAAALVLSACRETEEVVVKIGGDGVMIAPTGDYRTYLLELDRIAPTTLLAPWTESWVSVSDLVGYARIEGAEVIVGLAPARRAQDEWNTPDQPARDLLRALEQVPPGPLAGVAGLHLELGASPPSEAYLTAVVTAISGRFAALPISFGIEGRAVPLARLQDAGFPPPPTLTPADLDSAADRDAWARAWATALRPRASRVVVHVRDAARERPDLDRLAALLGSGVPIWATVDLRAPLAATATAALTGAQRARSTEAVRDQIALLRPTAAKVLIRGVESFTHDSALTTAPVAHPREGPQQHVGDVEARATAVEARLWRCCMRDGQIVSVLDDRTGVELGPNRWQEDACWMTGLYAAAASFRAAVTGDADAADRARAAFEALHTLASATPQAGEVVRNTQRALYDQPRAVEPGATTKKRWRKAPDRELYWVGDVSVDQLSGWFLGMTVYHDLVATAAERAVIAADVRAVLDNFLANDLHTVAYGDGRTTFGDLRAQPVLALAFFQIGFHVTGDARYRAELVRLMDEESMHWQIANVLALYRGAQRYGSDHFYASGLLPLLAYEPDPARRAKLDIAAELVHAIKRGDGDAYADMVYGVLHPHHDAGRRAVLELIDYQPPYLDNARFLAAHSDDRVPAAQYHPLARRPAGELDFDYVPPGERQIRGGLEGRFTGVGFLLTYWMGRFYARM